MTFRFYALTLITLLLACAPAWAMDGGATPVEVDVIIKERVQQKIKISGRIQSQRLASLSPQISGKVMAVLVKQGELVKKRQVLIQLDDQTTKLKLAELGAQKALIQTQIDRLSKMVILQKEDLEELEGAEAALAGSVSRSEMRTSKRELIDLQGQWSQASSQLSVLETQKEQADLQLSHHQLLAPFDGQITAKMVSEGAWVNLGQGCLTILDPTSLQLILDCPSQYWGTSAESLEGLQVMISNTQEKISTKSWVAQQTVDPKSKTFQWLGLAQVNDKSQASGLVAGMAIEAELPTSLEQEVLTVDHNAILKNDAGAFVYKVIPSEKGMMVLPMGVKVIYRNAQRSVIVSPALKPDDQVVSEGGERLFPMMPVMIQGAQK
jgi:RND family efflux transporter MFP subunit